MALAALWPKRRSKRGFRKMCHRRKFMVHCFLHL
jgi:hypothetical protein